jgi:hypothetical protein
VTKGREIEREGRERRERGECKIEWGKGERRKMKVEGEGKRGEEKERGS